MTRSFPLGPPIPGVRKIAVLRANGIGDLMFALPALDALTATYPQAEIVLLGLDWHAAFLSSRPAPVHRVVPVPPWPGVRDVPVPVDAGERERFFAAMAAERFDLALQLHGGGRNSNPFVLALGARCTAGLATGDAPPLDRSLRYVYYQSETQRLLEVVSLVGCRPVTLEARLAVTAADRVSAGNVLVAVEAPYAVLSPGAGDARRRWAPERFAAVADALAAEGLDVVVTGAGADSPLTAAVVAAASTPVLDLAGRLDLSALTGVLAGAAVFVGNDSGPLHLATAIGTPTVGIYWCGNLVNAGPPTRACHRPILSWVVRCPVCACGPREPRCAHDCSFVDDVPVEEVAAAARDLVGATASRSPAG